MADLNSILATRLYNFTYHVQGFSKLCGQTVAAIFKRPRYVKEIMFQMDSIGVGSVPIILLTGVFTGMVLVLQTANQLQVFGATMYVGKMVSLGMIKELGPVLASLMVTGRVGSGIAAELGSMKDTEQIDAMMVEGTDPIKRLVLPRLLACVFMLPLLTVLADAVGIIGGYLIATYSLRIDATFYWTMSFQSLAMRDVLQGLLKPAFFGFIIAMVGCYKGLNTSGGTVGVGRTTTESVVISSILVIGSDFFITKIMMFLLY